uniref:small monomeric GTPase n=1 Tax=Geospiza parvula TaxID=87175 RepID=A0A8C3QC78_GEOPR
MLLIPEDTMSQYSTNFLLLPIPEYPALDCAPNKIIKLVVLGGSGVGKTALVVRFLTKRFIGDYEANTGRHGQHLLPGADKPLHLLGRRLRLRVLHHGLRELPPAAPAAPAHPQDPPQRQHPPAAHGQQGRPAEGQAGVLQGGAAAGHRAGWHLLRGVGAGELRGRARGLPAVVPGAQQEQQQLQWGEEERSPPGEAQVTQHAGLEEAFEAGSDFQRQICHHALMFPPGNCVLEPWEKGQQAGKKGHQFSYQVV